MKEEDVADSPNGKEDDSRPWLPQPLTPPGTELERQAPLNGFFQDPIFALVHATQGILPKQFQEAKQLLTLLTDESIADVDRANAALSLCKQVIARSVHRGALTPEDLERAISWSDLSLKLGNVSAATELAQLHLSAVRVSLEMQDDHMGLPIVGLH